MHRPAATGARGGREVEGHVRAGQMIGQRFTFTWRWFGRQGLVSRGSRLSPDPCDIGVEIFEAEVQLVAAQAFRPPSEPAALEGLHDVAESVDLGFGPGPLPVEGRRQRADHAMQRRDVVRQGSEVYVHDRSLILGVPPAERPIQHESIGRSLTPPRPVATDVRVSASRCRRAGRTTVRRSAPGFAPVRCSVATGTRPARAVW